MLKLSIITTAILIAVPAYAVDPKSVPPANPISPVKPIITPEIAVPPTVQTGRIAEQPSSGVPKGWIACEKTDAVKYCEMRQKAHDATVGKEDPVKWIVRLPANGKVEDLNAFIHAAEDSLAVDDGK